MKSGFKKFENVRKICRTYNMAIYMANKFMHKLSIRGGIHASTILFFKGQKYYHNILNIIYLFFFFATLLIRNCLF